MLSTSIVIDKLYYKIHKSFVNIPRDNAHRLVLRFFQAKLTSPIWDFMMKNEHAK